jgi:hypothetical protein
LSKEFRDNETGIKIVIIKETYSEKNYCSSNYKRNYSYWSRRNQTSVEIISVTGIITTGGMLMRYYIKMMKDRVGYPDLNFANVLDVSSVVEFYFAGFEREYWDIHTDFPSFLPTYPSNPLQRQYMMFLETAAPSKIVSEKYGYTKWDGPDRFGAIVSVSSVDHVIKNGLWKEFAGDVIPNINDVWVTTYTLVASAAPSLPCQLLGQIIFSVDAEGKLNRNDECGTTGIYMPIDGSTRAEREFHANNILTMLKPLMFAAHVSSQPGVKHKVIPLSSGLRRQLSEYNRAPSEYITLEKDDFTKYMREEPYERLSKFCEYPTTDNIFRSNHKHR